jgi:anti-sigma factor ChrR (cupin superfamily)
MSSSRQDRCDQVDLVATYVVGAIPRSGMPAAEAHISSCSECQQELAELRAVMDGLSWHVGISPSVPPLWDRLLERISAQAQGNSSSAPDPQWREPDWEEAAPGIFCKLLSTDQEQDRVSMLVRLEAGVAYPPHDHAGVEELHLLQGELWIDGRKLYPGDYSRAEPGSGDQRVWTETGCTCLLITSPSDVLR